MLGRGHRIWTLFATVLVAARQTQGAAVHLADERPEAITEVEPGVILIDFGRVAFGNVRLMPPAGAKGALRIHFGEALSNGRINRRPPGTVRYKSTAVELAGKTPVVAAPAPDSRNTQTASKTHPPAILTPPEWGVVLPFRWVEIEGWSGTLHPEQIVRQAAFSKGWNDEAAAFKSSDEMLNRIWELCRYSIKATTFAGLYVDGDRERIPYEADAYLNQLSQYYTDNDVQMARDTIDHLLAHATWPSEWAPHMVFMVHADWMQTGDKAWLAGRYDRLKSKLLLGRRGEDGLISSNAQQIKRTDLVDWPHSERDQYVFTSRNTVVNAFHLRAMALMADMARALGKDGQAAAFESQARASMIEFQRTLFDAGTGLYRDGPGTGHSSLHANLFPLAFGLVPESHREKTAGWLADRGMKCSVYAAQYLLEGLFQNGADSQALELITAKNDRSWRHMLESGTTITWEAWDQKYKPNQDWNHAWGAAPANLLPRFVLGVQPQAPGWTSARICPYIGNLQFAGGIVPTPLGPIRISWKNANGFTLEIELPEGMDARVELPAAGKQIGVFNGDSLVKAARAGNRWVLDQPVTGTVTLDVK